MIISDLQKAADFFATRRPFLTSPLKGRNKDLSQFGRKSPLKRFLSPDDGGTEGGVKTIEDLEGSFYPAEVVTLRTLGIYW